MRKKELTIYPDEVVVTNEPDKPKWYAMKVAKPNWLQKVLAELKDKDIEAFSPYDIVYSRRKGKIETSKVSMVGNFVFCKSSEKTLVDVVNTPGLPIVFFYTRVTQKSDNSKRVIIEDKEMDRFMTFANAEALHPQLLTIEQAKEEMYGGKEIEFKQGIFKGHKAVVSNKKHHRQRVVVTLANCMALTIELPKKKNIDFPNPYHKEMKAAWQVPSGYDDEQVHDALSPLAAFLPKAMQLNENGETTKALGVCFDLLDMLIDLKSRDLKFFIDDEGATMYSWALAEVALYPICKIYNDEKTSQEVKSEIYSRIEAYGKTYTFPEKLCCGRAYEPNEVFREFGSSVRELDYYGFFGLNPNNIHEVQEAQ